MEVTSMEIFFVHAISRCLNKE